MCLILIAHQAHRNYPLVVAANRDEFLDRATRPAQWWSEVPQLLAGKDLEANGTWMGVTRSGRFAAITNVREPHITTPAACSRGLLPRRYLEEGINDNDYACQLRETKNLYSGYNLLFGNNERLHYYSNRQDELIALSPGIYGLSNARLDTPWPKVTNGKRLLADLLQSAELETEQVLKLLNSTKLADDGQLPNTGLSIEWERRLSAIRITGPDYGTRCSTVLLIDQQGHTKFTEKTLQPREAINQHTFTIGQ